MLFLQGEDGLGTFHSYSSEIRGLSILDEIMT